MIQIPLKEHLIIAITEGQISSEKEFRAAAKAKFEKAFGDDLDKGKMKKTIDGIINDNDKLVSAGKWGELMGVLNKSFSSK